MDIMLDPKYASTILKASKIFLKMADKATTSYGNDRAAYDEYIKSLGAGEGKLRTGTVLANTLQKTINDLWDSLPEQELPYVSSGSGSFSVDSNGQINVSIDNKASTFANALKNNFYKDLNSSPNKPGKPDPATPLKELIFEKVVNWELAPKKS